MHTQKRRRSMPSDLVHTCSRVPPSWGPVLHPASSECDGMFTCAKDKGQRGQQLQLRLVRLGCSRILKRCIYAVFRLSAPALGEDQDVRGPARHLRVRGQLERERRADEDVLDVTILRSRLSALAAAMPAPIYAVLGQAVLGAGR